ncbi:MAG: hypothetical protein WCT27_04435 [Patescibacteria group bacterium]|jgi:ComF family protein
MSALAHTAAQIIWQCLKRLPTTNAITAKPTILVPVPLHPRRLRNRGFNQSKLIANELGELLGAKVEDLLVRTRYTESQMSLARHERLQNVIGAFKMKNDFEKMPENVIIIDDVATTLATLHECASVLKSHGAKTVRGFVVARGS